MTGLCAIAATAALLLGMTAFGGGSSGRSLGRTVESRTVDRSPSRELQRVAGQQQLPTEPAAFFQPGTQPDPTGENMVPIWSSFDCHGCHGGYLYPEKERSYAEPWDGWSNSMMAQSARDPIWLAALTIANQDAAGSGEFCIRCHAPGAWLGGRSSSGDTSEFTFDDWDGVNCHFCHRLVSPVLTKDSPVEDGPILAALDFPPCGHHGNAQFVVDPESTRRGPFDDVPMNMHEPDPIIFSPFHRDSASCGVCHDVSNPVFMRQKDGSYVPTALDAPHPTMNPHDMMPEQRTYSEWLNSQFAKGGVHFPDGRFGGNHPTGVMQSCQDCHMPKKYTGGCFVWEIPPFFPRPDMPKHHFAGANTWVLAAVHDMHEEWITGLTEESVADAHARTADMLRNAADMELDVINGDLRVRIINWSGHKLPTGYPEGRRMWLNVRFFDENQTLIDERGEYDFATADLNVKDTKVYEVHLGMDETMANLTGLPEGKSFHLVLNNVVLKDNRIPPVGFTNAAFEQIRAQPVGYAYDDGQHWDDTLYGVPDGAAYALVTLYYQTTSREYIEFLRDTNETDNAGQIAYDQWVQHGKSAPLDMASSIIKISPAPGNPADLNGDGVVDVLDLLILLDAWGACADCGDCPADLNDDCSVDVLDLLFLLDNWG
jgi:hypothetical protein